MSLSLVSSPRISGVHLVEPGVDQVLLRRQIGVDLLMDLGGRVEPSCSRCRTALCWSAAATAASRSADACSRTWAIASWTAASMVPRISAAARNCSSAESTARSATRCLGPA